MPSKRTPISRSGRRPIPDAATEAFGRLLRARSARGWWVAHDELFDLLQPLRRIPPWQFPILIMPDEPDDEAPALAERRALYWELQALWKERRHRTPTTRINGGRAEQIISRRIDAA